MSGADEAADPFVVRVDARRWWWGLIAPGVGLAIAVAAMVAGMWVLATVLLISVGSHTAQAFGRRRVLRDLGPLARIDADGLTVLVTVTPWGEIATIDTLGPGFTFLGFRRSRWAVTTKAAVRFGRRTGRRPDRVVLPLSGLDCDVDDLVAAVHRFAPPGVLRA